MTKEELKQLKELLSKACNKLDKEEEEHFYKERSLTKFEEIHSILLEAAHLKLSLDLGFYDQYLLNNENETESLR